MNRDHIHGLAVCLLEFGPSHRVFEYGIEWEQCRGLLRLSERCDADVSDMGISVCVILARCFDFIL